VLWWNDLMRVHDNTSQQSPCKVLTETNSHFGKLPKT